MKASDRAILIGVAVVALAVGFYVMVLGPKRDEASKLNDQIDQLHASISQSQQVATFAEQARKNFPRYYGRLVVLGKAVPEDADTASMLVQLSSVADRSKVDFRAIKLNADASGTGTSSADAAATPPATGTTGTAASPSSAATTGSSTGSSSSSGSTTTPSTTSTGTSSGATATSSDSASTLVPATESNAASLPIGAVVGPAGLPTMPYDVSLTGSFFDVANFIGGIDGLVSPHGSSQIAANGRLLTVDGFALNINAPGASPKLNADFALTSYVAPATQGLTGGASSSGPAPASPTEPQAQPASATVAK
jgi:Tfp pilus assembly protein PilO